MMKSLVVCLVIVSLTLAESSSVIVVGTKVYTMDDASFQDFVIQEYSFTGEMLSEGIVTESRVNTIGFAMSSCPAVDSTNRAMYYVNEGIEPSISKLPQFYLYHHFVSNLTRDLPIPVDLVSIYCQAVTSPGPGNSTPRTCCVLI